MEYFGFRIVACLYMFVNMNFMEAELHGVIDRGWPLCHHALFAPEVSIWANGCPA